MNYSIIVGYEPRETDAYLVAVDSIRRFWPDARIRPLILEELRKKKLYTRPTESSNGQMIDVISQAPMSTEFAISRFLTPSLIRRGWALFIDCDMLIRTNIRELFRKADDSKAVMCVQHQYEPKLEMKMDSQQQTKYPRKNWSSVMLFNCDHPANKDLTVELVNKLPGRDLHNFCWLSDAQIGTLDPQWNYLVGESTPTKISPKIVHFTNGIPTMSGYENCEFSDEWRKTLWDCLRRLSFSYGSNSTGKD